MWYEDTRYVIPVLGRGGGLDDPPEQPVAMTTISAATTAFTGLILARLPGRLNAWPY